MIKIPYKKRMFSTDLSNTELVKNIMFELDKLGYDVIREDRKSIEFKYNIWRFGSRTETFRRVDGGIFEINPEGGSLIFTFYISLTFEILLTGIIALIGLFQDPFILHFIVFIWLMFLFRVFAVRDTGMRMLVNVIKATV
ncbi:hypothetical protein ASU31_16015 [Pedobacter ginsenosidimutans]|uniref:Uncharacterized protein n=1 Tax=Pedobacter ginsenosidimutans TaxID=687842 RepID=A0A0T5VND7_9SPHI|nr:hypothetical protein [Pedobacter ginsenosidimutans]KRT15177.1 hypothetical protein ASU31_16015 [Pedobacter ginsenosidimutans]